MISAVDDRSATLTLDALAAGAADHVTTPNDLVNPRRAAEAVRATLVPQDQGAVQHGRRIERRSVGWPSSANGSPTERSATVAAVDPMSSRSARRPADRTRSAHPVEPAGRLRSTAADHPAHATGVHPVPRRATRRCRRAARARGPARRPGRTRRRTAGARRRAPGPRAHLARCGGGARAHASGAVQPALDRRDAAQRDVGVRRRRRGRDPERHGP